MLVFAGVPPEDLIRRSPMTGNAAMMTGRSLMTGSATTMTGNVTMMTGNTTTMTERLPMTRGRKKHFWRQKGPFLAIGAINHPKMTKGSHPLKKSILRHLVFIPLFFLRLTNGPFYV